MKKTLIGWLLDNKDVAYTGIYKPEGDNWIPCTITYSEDEWEDVEVVRMYCPECQTVMTKKEHEQNKCCKNAVELRGTYRRRKPEPEPWFRARVVLAGSELDDPEFTRLLESCGA